MDDFQCKSNQTKNDNNKLFQEQEQIVNINQILTISTGKVKNKIFNKDFIFIDQSMKFLKRGKLFIEDLSQRSQDQQFDKSNIKLVEKDFILTNKSFMIQYLEVQKKNKTLVYQMDLKFNYIINKCPSIYIENNKFFGFTIKQNLISFNFYYNQKQEISNWIKQLQRYSVQNISFFEQCYEVVHQIGKGSSGVVYKVKANDQVSDKIYFAAKVCNKKEVHHQYSQLIFQGIKNEINILRTMKGKNNIINLLQVFENKKQIIQILEYMKYGDLHSLLLKQKIISENYIHKIFLELNKALIYLNKKNIIHRDIKLTNILIKNMNDDNIELRLADFGLAQYYIPHKSQKLKQKCGTLGFMAPEIFSKVGYGEKVDIFAVGVMLYTMYNGTRPFKGKTESEIIKNTQKKEIEFKRNQWNHASHEFIDFINQCTQKVPKDRISIENIQKHPWIEQFGNIQPIIFQQQSLLEIQKSCIEIEQDDVKIPTKTFNHLIEASINYIKSKGDLDSPKLKIRQDQKRNMSLQNKMNNSDLSQSLDNSQQLSDLIKNHLPQYQVQNDTYSIDFKQKSQTQSYSKNAFGYEQYDKINEIKNELIQSEKLFKNVQNQSNKCFSTEMQNSQQVLSKQNMALQQKNNNSDDNNQIFEENFNVCQKIKQFQFISQIKNAFDQNFGNQQFKNSNS